jgi:hypothetical protein
MSNKEKPMAIWAMIPCINAGDLPEEVLDDCTDMGIRTFNNHSLAFIEDDGRPFAEWLKAHLVPQTKNQRAWYTWKVGIVGE